MTVQGQPPLFLDGDLVDALASVEVTLAAARVSAGAEAVTGRVQIGDDRTWMRVLAGILPELGIVGYKEFHRVGKRVRYHISLEHLGALVRRHSADDTAAKAIGRIMRADVIVIDDIGLLPVTADTAEALYRVVDAAYEKRSIALSSNLHPAGFDELMPKTIANATVDRLMHHAHLVLTAGDSIRLTQATAAKGVTPLTN